MKNKFLKKLKSNHGESIAEVLVALLISSLALVMLASMISTTASLTLRSKDRMTDYYKANTILEDMEKESEDTSASAVTDLDLKISNNGNLEISLPSDKLTCYKNQQLGKAVYAYIYTP